MVSPGAARPLLSLPLQLNLEQKNLLKVPMWWPERDSNLRPSGWKAQNPTTGLPCAKVEDVLSPWWGGWAEQKDLCKYLITNAIMESYTARRTCSSTSAGYIKDALHIGIDFSKILEGKLKFLGEM